MGKHPEAAGKFQAAHSRESAQEETLENFSQRKEEENKCAIYGRNRAKKQRTLAFVSKETAYVPQAKALPRGRERESSLAVGFGEGVIGKNKPNSMLDLLLSLLYSIAFATSHSPQMLPIT